MPTEATHCLSMSKRGMHERGMVVLGDAEQPLYAGVFVPEPA